MVRPVIHSRKHYVQWTITPVAVGTTVVKNIAVGTVTADVDSDIEVEDGSNVKAIFLELWLIGQSDTASGNFLVTVYFKPGAAAALSHANQIALNAYTNKNNVLYHTQGISNDGVANAQPILRQWFKIPKGKQRVPLAGAFQIAVATQAEAVNFCGFATYKEYS